MYVSPPGQTKPASVRRLYSEASATHRHSNKKTARFGYHADAPTSELHAINKDAHVCCARKKVIRAVEHVKASE